MPCVMAIKPCDFHETFANMEWLAIENPYDLWHYMEESTRSCDSALKCSYMNMSISCKVGEIGTVNSDYNNDGFCIASLAAKLQTVEQFLPVRCYASTGTSYGPLCLFVCICHKSVFYQNGWTDRAGFWHGGFF